MIIPELVKTNDGSDTLYVRNLNEHYHSTFGAVQESMHIFISAGLKKCGKNPLTVFEAGFGTGLNAYLTVLETINTKQTIRYITVEKYPLPQEIWSTLNYPAIVPNGSPILFQQINEAKWDAEVQITDHFSILKLSSDLQDVNYSDLPLFDVIYFDAFSPEKQPELWQTSIFRQLANHCSPMAILVTYCVKGKVRRTLNEAGFITGKIQGPPGKREILRCTKTGI